MESNINVTPNFVLAGNAVFTVSNGAGRHFTYKVYRREPDDKHPQPAYFIKVLTSPDDYTYLGLLTRPHWVDGRAPMGIKLTSMSKFKEGAECLKVARWALRAIWQVAEGRYRLPAGYTIQHVGKCGRCGRALTTPESLDTGFGEECASIVGVEWAERDRRQQELGV